MADVHSIARSASEAKTLGLKLFFTGQPCIHGHVSERYVKGKACKECAALSSMARYSRLLPQQKVARNRRAHKRQIALHGREPGRQMCRAYKAKNQEEVNRKAREYYSNNRQKCLQARISWGKRNPERIRELWRRKSLKKFGLTKDDYYAMLTLQGSCCAICRTDTTKSGRRMFSIDHDHSTGRVRGLLCNSCNLALGKFHDSLEVLRAAVAYLEKARNGAL